jgi:hypothetical protein
LLLYVVNIKTPN